MGEGQPAGARPPKAPDPLIGRVINDRFRIVSLIARGGMGKVYRAEQAPLGREIALKVLNPNYSGDSDPEFHKRFFLEASTCSKLTHPNTVTIFDYGRTDDDVYYIAMELLEGRTVHRALREDGPFPAARAMHIARQICRSLREAHGLGVIHRDLKPANIFLVHHGDESDFVKVLDFGLVKDLDEGEDLTQTGLFMGSPKYMSPEQIRGEDVDARADVYALGVILYEMLTGKVPFDGPSSVNVLMAHVHEAPPPMAERNPAAALSPALEQVVMRALAKQPAQRFESMDEMLSALKAIDGLSTTQSLELPLGGETTSHPPATLTRTITADDLAHLDEAPRRRWIAPLALLGAAVVIGALVLVGLQASEAPPAPAPPAARIEPPPPEKAPAPAPIETTRVVLRSTPPGATVRVGEVVYGPTPAEIEWTGDAAARGRQVTFLFELDEHRDYSITRVITGDRLEVTAELERIERERVRRPPRRPRRPPPRDHQPAERPLNGFKMDPY